MIVGGLCETAFELKASDTDGLQFSQISSTHSRRNEMTTRLQAHALHVIPNRAVGEDLANTVLITQVGLCDLKV